MSDFKITTPGFDGRFPHINATRRCWQNYVDFHRCVNAKGEDSPICKQFFQAYNSLCPVDWTARWDEEREEGRFPVNFEE
ncbi:hypothetical protein BB559_006391 [Furculomyces boomerangus]|uniref:Cytochrome c oxidase subunit n=2 Tax=Harpellales TaxID=61421 RepID=A0A2T9XZM4_9FUNG|nr:hypothetical protein BB559_007020 [Furculomyces boomerangus]PVU86823.1 hypothetical protein BB559_006391 [Furculomyces boomerangus]PVZ98434.1 hypothetical protein BB558_005560 [Smittium angustum]